MNQMTLLGCKSSRNYVQAIKGVEDSAGPMCLGPFIIAIRSDKPCPQSPRATGRFGISKYD